MVVTYFTNTISLLLTSILFGSLTVISVLTKHHLGSELKFLQTEISSIRTISIN